MAHDTDEPLVVYSDYVCPFCYLGRESLNRYREDAGTDIEVDWQPFDLRSGKRGPDGEIDHTVDDGKNEAYYEQVRENVEKLREKYGLDEMRNLEEVPEVDSLPAQVASYHVKEEYPQDWEAFDEAIFEALWVEGRDIGDASVLADLAESVGLDGAEIREVLADDALRERVFEEFEAAQQRRITGVPTFVYGGAAARGAVPPEHLRRLVEEA